MKISKLDRQKLSLETFAKMLRGGELKKAKGRPRKDAKPEINIFDELEKNILKGMPFSQACAITGFSYLLFQDIWNQAIDDLADGYTEIDSDFVLFKNRIEKAKAHFVLGQIENVKIGDKGWQSNAWLLERLESETFNLNKNNSDKKTSLPRIEIINDITPSQKYAHDQPLLKELAEKRENE